MRFVIAEPLSPGRQAGPRRHQATQAWKAATLTYLWGSAESWLGCSLTESLFIHGLTAALQQKHTKTRRHSVENCSLLFGSLGFRPDGGFKGRTSFWSRGPAACWGGAVTASEVPELIKKQDHTPVQSREGGGVCVWGGEAEPRLKFFTSASQRCDDSPPGKQNAAKSLFSAFKSATTKEKKISLID